MGRGLSNGTSWRIGHHRLANGCGRERGLLHRCGEWRAIKSGFRAGFSAHTSAHKGFASRGSRFTSRARRFTRHARARSPVAWHVLPGNRTSPSRHQPGQGRPEYGRRRARRRRFRSLGRELITAPCDAFNFAGREQAADGADNRPPLGVWDCHADDLGEANARPRGNESEDAILQEHW